MRPHLAMEQQQPVLRLKAKGLPLREIGPAGGLFASGGGADRRSPSRRQARREGRAPRQGRQTLADREITPGSP